MGLYQAYKMDEKKEQEGIEVKYPANNDGTFPTFRITRIGPNNLRYAKTFEIETRPYQRQIDLGTMDKMIERELLRRVFVRSVLVGWDHVQDINGNEITFTEENALKLFRELPDLYADLHKQSMDIALFRDASLEESAKN